MIRVRYTPSGAGGVYLLSLTPAQWDVLRANPDYQQVAEDPPDSAATPAQTDAPETIPAPPPFPEPEPPTPETTAPLG
jgi:hypothetical protein